MHVAPFGSVWVQLVEQVAPPFIKNRPVGVVMPLGGRMEMINGTAGVGGRFGDGGADRIGGFGESIAPALASRRRGAQGDDYGSAGDSHVCMFYFAEIIHCCNDRRSEPYRPRYRPACRALWS